MNLCDLAGRGRDDKVTEGPGGMGVNTSRGEAWTLMSLPKTRLFTKSHPRANKGGRKTGEELGL